ncbi:hypothetical protein [Paenibacillus sp. L3-i20]|uniref:hypothetical protein n=1 Tax=Paenibacillus sp. L3-i20 TaxID=2905833 RepID=UPI001EDCB437|nr:hypothetical protein [Paenibacillus sp. L3-i20]GKU80164.1 hypothetical protein L3i20_v245610 [Paenibacillus sp. L3-i20]
MATDREQRITEIRRMHAIDVVYDRGRSSLSVDQVVLLMEEIDLRQQEKGKAIEQRDLTLAEWGKTITDGVTIADTAERLEGERDRLIVGLTSIIENSDDDGAIDCAKDALEEI